MAYTVDKGYLSEWVRELGRDILGSYDDATYYLFRSGDDTFQLLVANENGTIDFSDWANVSFEGCDTYTFIYDQSANHYYKYYKSAENGSGSVLNPNYCVTYGSGEMMPSLVERGGKNVQAALLVGLCVLFLYIVCRDIFGNIMRR